MGKAPPDDPGVAVDQSCGAAVADQRQIEVLPARLAFGRHAPAPPSANLASQSRTSLGMRESAARAGAQPTDRIGEASARRDDGEAGFVGLVVADENRRAAEEGRDGEKRRDRPALVVARRLQLDGAMRIHHLDGILGSASTSRVTASRRAASAAGASR